MHRRRRTVSTKCECHAELVIVLDVICGFSVKKFTETHNHPFAGKGEMQFLRCSRSLTEFHKRFIFDASKLNIGASRAYIIFKTMIGSYEDVGATVVDFKNFSRDIKQHIGKHDADMIVQKFRDIQESSDPSFKFEYRLDYIRSSKSRGSFRFHIIYIVFKYPVCSTNSTRSLVKQPANYRVNYHVGH